MDEASNVADRKSAEAGVVCAACGYSLSGLASGSSCPECGRREGEPGFPMSLPGPDRARILAARTGAWLQAIGAAGFLLAAPWAFLWLWFERLAVGGAGAWAWVAGAVFVAPECGYAVARWPDRRLVWPIALGLGLAVVAVIGCVNAPLSAWWIMRAVASATAALAAGCFHGAWACDRIQDERGGDRLLLSGALWLAVAGLSLISVIWEFLSCLMAPLTACLITWNIIATLIAQAGLTGQVGRMVSSHENRAA